VPQRPFSIGAGEGFHVEGWVERRCGSCPAQVHPDDVAGVDHRQHAGDAGPHVGAVHGIPLVSEPPHQLRPGLRDGEEVESPGTEGRREAVSGQGRDDEVEGVRGVAAMRPGVGERTDEARELHG
jgi:hypothetical protein